MVFERWQTPSSLHDTSQYSGRSQQCCSFKRSLTGLNLEFSFFHTSCLTKAEEPSLSYYLRIAGGRIIGFIPFPRVLVLCEMQSVSSRIWTHVAVSISYDDNHCIMGASFINPLVTVPSAWVTICITFTFMSIVFFSVFEPGLVTYLSFRSLLVSPSWNG